MLKYISLYKILTVLKRVLNMSFEISIYSKNSNFKLFQRFLGNLVLSVNNDTENSLEKKDIHKQKVIPKKTRASRPKTPLLPRQNRNRHPVSRKLQPDKSIKSNVNQNTKNKNIEIIPKKLEFLSFQEKERYFCENTCDYAKKIDGKTIYSVGRTINDDYTSVKFKDSIIKYRYKEIGSPKGLNCEIDIYKRIDIQCNTKEILDNLLKECYNYKFYSRYPNKINVFKWYSSYWDKHTMLEKRDINTIYLDKKVLDNFVSDINLFIGNKDKYSKFGIPYKRNYLLSGIPGTGKTSLIMSIASKLDYSIYIIPFTSSLDDVSFTEALSNIPEKSILIMEDVDSLFLKRENKSTGLTFSGMINALDGLTIRDGLITFLTTNHIENIDEALLRPGRVDYHMEFTYTTDEQKTLMCKSFIPDISDDNLNEFINASKSIKITTAILQYFLFEYEGKKIYDKKAIKRLRQLSQKYIKKDSLSSSSMYN